MPELSTKVYPELALLLYSFHVRAFRARAATRPTDPVARSRTADLMQPPGLSQQSTEWLNADARGHVSLEAAKPLECALQSSARCPLPLSHPKGSLKSTN